MRNRELVALRKRLGTLTRSQRRQVVTDLDAVEHKAASVEVIENQSPTRPDCPHCGSAQVVRNGTADDLQRFKCRGCLRTFNALTGTPLARLHMRGKWMGQAEALRVGLTIRQAALRLGVNTKTAFLWRHRFLAVPKTIQAQTLSGIAEADESYFLKSAKGQRKGLGRVARKRGGKATKRGTSRDLVPVLIARDRAGATANFVLEASTAKDIGIVLRSILPDDTVLVTDGSTALAAVARHLGVEHHAVNLSAGMRGNGAWHVQNVNAFVSRLRGWLRRFKGVATRYLENYLGWFRALDRSPGFLPEPASLLALAVRG